MPTPPEVGQHLLNAAVSGAFPHFPAFLERIFARMSDIKWMLKKLDGISFEDFDKLVDSRVGRRELYDICRTNKARYGKHQKQEADIVRGIVRYCQIHWNTVPPISWVVHAAQIVGYDPDKINTNYQKLFDVDAMSTPVSDEYFNWIVAQMEVIPRVETAPRYKAYTENLRNNKTRKRELGLAAEQPRESTPVSPTSMSWPN